MTRPTESYTTLNCVWSPWKKTMNIKLLVILLVMFLARHAALATGEAISITNQRLDFRIGHEFSSGQSPLSSNNFLRARSITRAKFGGYSCFSRYASNAGFRSGSRRAYISQAGERFGFFASAAGGLAMSSILLASPQDTFYRQELDMHKRFWIFLCKNTLTVHIHEYNIPI